MRADEKNLSVYTEKKKHGTEWLPFAVYGTMMPNLFSSYPLHCHEEIEVVYVDCGNCRYTVSGNDIDLTFGDILVMMPWVLHSFHLEKPEHQFLASTYLMSLNMLNTSSVDICSSQYFAPMLTGSCSDYCLITWEHPCYREYKELIEEMFNIGFDHPPFYEIRLKSLVSGLLYRLLRDGLIRIFDRPTESGDVKAVRQVVDYIGENYRENITLAKLAEVVNMSETGLSRLFRSITGMSCIDYVIEYRMSKAFSMVRMTDKPIIEIAYEVGFNNISYFNRTFKKHFQRTPSQCRKE
ncbi:MAG: helix-turn-helix domain-containing protein [Clostridia bacterium]|nr:helix-turn-helix domain-containing protein [Clostridia bacterium]